MIQPSGMPGMGSEYRPKERFLHYTQHWHSMQAQSDTDSDNDDAVLRQPAAPASISDDSDIISDDRGSEVSLILQPEPGPVRFMAVYYRRRFEAVADGGTRTSTRWPHSRGELLYLQTAFW